MNKELQKLKEQQEQIEKHWMDKDFAEDALEAIGEEMAKIIRKEMGR